MDKCLAFVKRLIQIIHLEKLLFKHSETVRMVETLYRRQDKKEILMNLWCRRILILLVAAGVSGLLWFVCMCQEAPADVIVDTYYLQPGKDQNQVTFDVEAQTGAGLAEEEITVEVGKAEGEKETEDAAEATPDPREMILSEIREAVEEVAAHSDEKIKLPAVVSGVDVTYRNPVYKKDFSAFYLGLSVIFLLPLMWRRQRLERLKEREKQLMYDYPELVNKLMLLLSAGLTVRGCFERMCGEYKKRMKEGGERRYVYEEICFSFQEMQNGVSEAKAIEEFGKRCRQLPYLRFSSMMNQNIRKGSDGLIRLLETEAIEAFEKRKEQVKVMGETAGTKLLIPMILMLGVVMAIIVIPAFMTM